jgi:membrane protease YdiL (CAAX protease family)
MSTAGPQDDEAGHSRNAVAMAVAFEGGLGLLALALGWLLGVWPIPGIERSETAWNDQLPALLWGLVATVPMLLGFWLIDRFPWGSLLDLKRDVERLVVPLFQGSSIVELAIVALTAGIGEEMLFRGLLQHGLAAWLTPPWGVWVALVAASAIFGCAHMLSATYLVLAAFIGLYLGLLLIWTENLMAPAVAHGLYDFVALLYLVRGGRSAHGAGEESPPNRLP